MSDARTQALRWAVLVTLGLQTFLGVLCLYLGVRGNASELVFGVATWVVAMLIGVATYKRKLRGQSMMPLRLAIAATAAGFVLCLWLAGVGRFGP